MIKECDEDLQHASEAPDAPSSAAAEGRPRRKAHSGERLAQARLAGSPGRTTLLVDTAHQGCDIARSHTYGPEPPGLPAPIAFPNPAPAPAFSKERGPSPRRRPEIISYFVCQSSLMCQTGLRSSSRCSSTYCFPCCRTDRQGNFHMG